jgi:hypothetical protein
MKMRDGCARRRLAGRESFSVEACACGAIHLTICFVTLRMDPRAFYEFAAMAWEAALQVKDAEPPVLH